MLISDVAIRMFTVRASKRAKPVDGRLPSGSIPLSVIGLSNVA